MPDRNEILSYLAREKPRFARDYGVSKIGLFGSAARGDQPTVNDVDILVDMNSPTFDHYMDLKFELENHFGLPVDLVLSDSLKPRLRPRVEREVVFA